MALITGGKMRIVSANIFIQASPSIRHRTKFPLVIVVKRIIY
jgi:hypothetical protein